MTLKEFKERLDLVAETGFFAGIVLLGLIGCFLTGLCLGSKGSGMTRPNSHDYSLAWCARENQVVFQDGDWILTPVLKPTRKPICAAAVNTVETTAEEP